MELNELDIQRSLNELDMMASRMLSTDGFGGVHFMTIAAIIAVNAGQPSIRLGTHRHFVRLCPRTSNLPPALVCPRPRQSGGAVSFPLIARSRVNMLRHGTLDNATAFPRR